MDAPPRERVFELFIGRLLRTGVIVAAAVVFFGGMLYLFAHASAHPAYHTFHQGAAFARTLAGILAGVSTLDSHAVIRLGLLLLIATPVLRVLSSLVLFALQRDGIYVVVTLIVLVVLLLGLSGLKVH